MKLKPITFREALVVLSKGGKIYPDPTEYNNHDPVYLNDKDNFQNIGYMEIVDLPDFKWYVEDDGEKGQKKQPQKKEMDIQISGEGLTVEKLDGFNDVTLQSHGVILIGGKLYSLREVIEVFVNHKREEAE